MTDLTEKLTRARPASPPVRHVSLILGGSAYVLRSDWDSGSLGMRAHTKAGKPRNCRGSARPLMISRCLTMDSIGERP